MENKDLLYVKKEGVATITLNRPEKLNAFSPPMIRDLVLALKEAQEDHEVKAILLTGAGKAFCAGGDVEAMSEGVGFFRPDVNLPAVKPHSLHIKNTLWKLIQQVPLALISSHMGIVVETGDHREGVRALLEKRKPDFKDV